MKKPWKAKMGPQLARIAGPHADKRRKRAKNKKLRELQDQLESDNHEVSRHTS